MNSSKNALQDKVLQIARTEKAKFRALIVDRDTMSSGLLADALVRVLKCEAVGTRPGELLRMLSAGNFDVVIISGDLNSKPSHGFDLASAVHAAYQDMPIVILLDQTTREGVINAL